MQTKLPISLINAFLEKKLIPVVGAGVSMSLKRKNGDNLFPSWTELLHDAADCLEVEAKSDIAIAVKAMLKLKKYEQAADLVREGLTGKLWDKFFNEKFNVKKNDISEDSLALPQAIWKISNKVITLNYDKVLRFACPELGVAELDNNSKEKLACFIGSDHNSHMVWHMHGHIDSTNEIIFTSESYNKLYSDKNTAYLAAIKTFQTLCIDKALIFVGCSLDDAELLKQISVQHQLFGSNTGPHYALIKESDEAAIKAKLNGLPIELITFF